MTSSSTRRRVVNGRAKRARIQSPIAAMTMVATVLSSDVETSGPAATSWGAFCGSRWPSGLVAGAATFAAYALAVNEGSRS
jgi:hypothetical protein